MFSYNFKYELKLLLRSRWIQLLSFLLLLLFGFSTFNGKQKVEKRKINILVAKQQVEESDQAMLKLLDSVEQGMEVSASSRTIPTNPMVVGNYHPRVVANVPQPMSFVSTGQSDVFTHYIKPTVRGDDFTLNFTEMTSPVQLLFGSFDLSFVIVYLLPLLIIAFSYNVLSSEKEQGSFPLLASQPISIRKWVFQKLILRFFWLLLLVLVSMGLVFILVGVYPLDWGNILALFGLTFSYMFFWFALAFLVNLFSDSSAKNAVSLIMLWVVIVLLIPSVINQLGIRLYPIPSRTLMIKEMRETKAEAAKMQDEILDNFLRDHPEYAINDSAQSRNFYHRYMASQKVVKDKLEPIIDNYEEQLRRQQLWSKKLQWISPAVVVQQSLNRLAGNSAEDYGNYRRQVIQFSEKWRNYFTNLLYNNIMFSKQDYTALPKFEYKIASNNTIEISVLALSLIASILLGVGFTSVKDISEKRRL